ncbi:hypothetical protein [Streptomyces sp. KL116D]|uniref:hypothetical protein n=1 Tax=Streptomyces sp. KL116D TaxID=3045152 RepID=UPI003555E5EE
MATNHVFQLLDHLLEQGVPESDGHVAAAGMTSLKRIVCGGSPSGPRPDRPGVPALRSRPVAGHAASEAGRITSP